jgi:hypothetical protein
MGPDRSACSFDYLHIRVDSSSKQFRRDKKGIILPDWGLGRIFDSGDGGIEAEAKAITKRRHCHGVQMNVGSFNSEGLNFKIQLLSVQ